MPARVAQALAPWLFGLALDHWGSGALAISADTGALAFLALFLLPSDTHNEPAADPQPARQ